MLKNQPNIAKKIFTINTPIIIITPNPTTRPINDNSIVQKFSVKYVKPLMMIDPMSGNKFARKAPKPESNINKVLTAQSAVVGDRKKSATSKTRAITKKIKMLFTILDSVISLLRSKRLNIVSIIT